MKSAGAAPSEMAFFSLLARCGGLSAAARELDLSTAAVSKRLSQMEARLGVRLLARTTRRVSLTPEGELYLEHARRILAEIDDMERMVASAVAAPGIPFERPSDERVDHFAAILADKGVLVSVRKSRGRDIRAACGQLMVEGQGRRSPAQQLAEAL